MAVDLGDIITSGGQAISDLFQSEGSAAEANSFTQASQLATQNASLAAASTRIQATQMGRQIYQAEGTQVTDVAGAGFAESGSALDLLRSSAQQGSLATALTNIQGAITENGYAEQAGAYSAAAASAGENASAQQFGAFASIGGTLANVGESLLTSNQTTTPGSVSSTSGLLSSVEDVGSSIWDGIGSVGDAVGGAISDAAGFVGDAVGAGVDAVADSGVGGVVEDAVGGIIGDVADAIFSVICTAYYRAGFIRYRTWIGCQLFGAACDGITFRGYYAWGFPIACLIQSSPIAARLLFPIFAAPIFEMAAQMGVGNSRFMGRALLKLFLLTSALVGLFIKPQGVRHAIKA